MFMCIHAVQQLDIKKIKIKSRLQFSIPVVVQGLLGSPVPSTYLVQRFPW